MRASTHSTQKRRSVRDRPGMNSHRQVPSSSQMVFPDLESTQTCLDRLSHRNREVSISFVFIELTTGLSSRRLIRNSRAMTKR